MTQVSDEEFARAVKAAKNRGFTGVDIGVSNDSFNQWSEKKRLPKQETRQAVMNDLRRIADSF